MADATGSSAGAGTSPGPGGAGAAGHGRGITQGQYQQPFLTSSPGSVNKTPPNVYPQTPHQHPIGLIPAPVGMSVPSPRPVYSQIFLPPQQHHHVVQSGQTFHLDGRYQQDYPAYGNSASSSTPLGFASWRMPSNALMSFAHQTPFFGSSSSGNSNGFQQNSSPYPAAATIWTAGYVQTNQTYCANYAPVANDPALQAPSFHNNINNNQKRDLDFATSFTVSSPLVDASAFEEMSQRSSAQIFQEAKNLDGTLVASGSLEIERSEATEESAPAPELEAQNQLGHDIGEVNSADNIILNCRDYRILLRKDLTNSDCGNIGRIVLPKRDAEANLPALSDKDGLILEMDDLVLPEVWKFKYRYWPNNKSRMYIMENTGEFVKRHNLEAGDVFMIYQHGRTGRHVARAVKASQLSSTMPALECQCMEEGNSGEDCGFLVCPLAKKNG